MASKDACRDALYTPYRRRIPAFFALPLVWRRRVPWRSLTAPMTLTSADCFEVVLGNPVITVITMDK